MNITVKQAKDILAQAGERWIDKHDLRRIMARAYDPIIKTAAEKLIITLI